MNMGIFIGILLMVIALFINYLILFKLEYTEDKSWEKIKKGDKVKHWLITYYLTWFIPFIPFVGFFIELVWFIIMVGPCEYRCTSKIFKEY